MMASRELGWLGQEPLQVSLPARWVGLLFLVDTVAKHTRRVDDNL